MKKLFEFANQYIASLKWQHFSLIKFCLIGLGVLIGILVPAEIKVTVGIVAGVIFVGTYIPVMVHFVKAWFNHK